MPDLPIITAFTTGATIILQMVLGFRISLKRNQLKQSLGDGNFPALGARIRAHGNLTENAPIILLTFALLELIGANTYGLILLAIAFFGGRLLHAISLEREPNTNKLRFWGSLSTYIVGFIGGAWLLFSAAILV